MCLGFMAREHVFADQALAHVLRECDEHFANLNGANDRWATAALVANGQCWLG